MGFSAAVEAGVIVAGPKMGVNPDIKGLLMLFVDAVGPTAAVGVAFEDAGVATGLMRPNKLPPPPRDGELDEDC